MCDLLVLDLVEKHIVTNQIVLTIGYDSESLTKGNILYSGEVTIDYYGRPVPKHAHGAVNLSEYTSSTNEIVNATMQLFERIVDDMLLVRRVNICVCNLKDESVRNQASAPMQMSLFIDYEAMEKQRQIREAAYEREKRSQHAMINIRRKFGKNAILKGMNFEDGATTIDRNLQIGGHKA
jgi:DNA polymerase V